MDEREDAQKEDTDTIQRGIEYAAKKIAHTTQSDRQKEVRKTPEDVDVRNEMQKNGGASLQCILLRDRKLVLEWSHPVKGYEASVQIQKKRRRSNKTDLEQTEALLHV